MQNQFPSFLTTLRILRLTLWLTLKTRTKGLTLIIYDYIFKVNPTCLDSLRTIWDQVLGKTKDTVSLTVLLGIHSIAISPKATQQVAAFATLLARRFILLKWTHPSPPTHNGWIHERLLYIKLGRVRFSLRGSLKTFCKTWQTFLSNWYPGYQRRNQWVISELSWNKIKVEEIKQCKGNEEVDQNWKKLVKKKKKVKTLLKPMSRPVHLNFLKFDTESYK